MSLFLHDSIFILPSLPNSSKHTTSFTRATSPMHYMIYWQVRRLKHFTILAASCNFKTIFYEELHWTSFYRTLSWQHFPIFLIPLRLIPDLSCCGSTQGQSLISPFLIFGKTTTRWTGSCRLPVFVLNRHYSPSMPDMVVENCRGGHILSIMWPT